jgi:hypothetical protein
MTIAPLLDSNSFPDIASQTPQRLDGKAAHEAHQSVCLRSLLESVEVTKRRQTGRNDCARPNSLFRLY